MHKPSLMKNLKYAILFVVLVFSCSKESSKRQPLDYLPQNPEFVFRINQLEGLKSSLKNNDLLKSLSSSEVSQNLTDKLDLIQYFSTEEEILLSFIHDQNDSLQYSLATHLNKYLFQIDSLPNHKLETITDQGFTFSKTTIDQHILYSVIKDSIFIGASTLDLLQNCLKSNIKGSEWLELLNSSNSGSDLSVFINNKNHSIPQNIFYLDSISSASFSSYYNLDIDLNQDAVIYNGVTKATDSTKSFINQFKGIQPQENELAKITPAYSDGFLSFTFANYSQLKPQLRLPEIADSLMVETSLFDNIIEVGLIFEGNDQAVVLNSLDDLSTLESLESSLIETYRQVEIHEFKYPELFHQSFGSLAPYSTATKYCQLNQFFVFSNSYELLQNIIVNFQNNTTLSHRDYYEDIKMQLSDESSLLMVGNQETLSNFFEKNLNEEQAFKLNQYKVSALQFIYDQDFAHINGIFKKAKTKAVDNSISEEFSIELDAALINEPQFVSNHITKEKEIVVQDIKNNLYLISNSGKVLWKKQLHGPILGQISQIDMYKNGRLQLAFATPHRVYVLDRNGKEVDPFPLKFNDDITQPLAVFDYDNNKKYRLIITQGNRIYMVDGRGKSVKGFNFKGTEKNLVHAPQHIRIGNKDYLLFQTEDKIYIQDRVGKTRVTPKNQYQYSDTGIYEFENKFITTTKDGILVTIDQSGNTASRDLKLTDHHKLVTTSKTLVAMSENRLTIKDKTIELDFGNYTDPDIFYLNDKIYVTVTDLQTQKVYLFDSNAKPINNFPVYGTSKMALDNIDKDRNLEFVTQGENNSILIYQIN